MMDSPPSYQRTAPLGADLLSQSPTVNLPGYSTLAPSCWWEEPALKVLESSCDINNIILICKFVPFRDPSVVVTVLSTRGKSWLDAFVEELCRNRNFERPPGNSIAKVVVDFIKRRPLSSTQLWNSDWDFSALDTWTNIPTIAEELDMRIRSIFCTITLPDWVAWYHGYRNEFASDLLDTVFQFRNNLARYIHRSDRTKATAILLQRALPSQQPLLCWIVSTALSFDISSSPYDALGFLICPIRQIFETQHPNILTTVQQLSILDIHFQLKVIHATNIKWPQPLLSKYLSFWETIQKESPENIALLNTESISRLYSNNNLLQETGYLRYIKTQWSELSNDAFACLFTDRKLIGYFQKLATIFVFLRNFHSSAAITTALLRLGLTPCKPSLHWNVIDPLDNYAACRALMAEAPCLPFMFPGNVPDKLLEALQFKRYFETSRLKRRASIDLKQKGEICLEYSAVKRAKTAIDSIPKTEFNLYYRRANGHHTYKTIVEHVYT